MNAVQGEYSDDEIMRFFLIFMPIVNLQFITTKKKGNIFFNLRRKRRIKKRLEPLLLGYENSSDWSYQNQEYRNNNIWSFISNYIMMNNE